MSPGEQVQERALTMAIGGAPFLVFLVYPLPIPLVPSIAEDFAVGVADLQLAIGGYPLGLGAALLAGGALSDRIGPTRAWIGSVVAFAACAMGCAIAGSTEVLIGWRVAQGLAGAVLLACSLSLIVTSVTPARRSRMTALWGAAIGLGLSVGPLAGAISVELGDWRPAFAGPGVLALGAALAGALTLKRVPAAAPVRRLDVPGAVTLALGLAALILAISRATAPGAGAVSLVLFGVAAVLLVAFWIIQRLRSEPMVDLGLLRERGYVAGLVAGLALAASILSLIVVFGSFLQDVVDLTPLETALWFLPWSLLAFGVALLAAALSRRVSLRGRLVAGLSLSAAGLLALLVVDSDSPAVWVLPGLVISGVGVGLANPALAAAAVAGIPAARSGMAAGAANTARQLGNAVGIAALVALVQWIAGRAASDSAGTTGAVADAIARGDLLGALALAPADQAAAVRALYVEAQTRGMHAAIVAAAAVAVLGVIAVLVLSREERAPAAALGVTGGATSAGSR